MSKLAYLQQKKLNPADELRELLNTLEDRGPSLKVLNSTKALILLRDLDIVSDLFAQLEATGLNLLSEQSRFKAIQSHFKRNAALILKALGGPEALDEFRPSPPPSRERWWWYSHELVAAQQRRLAKQIATTVLVIVGMIGAIVLIFNTVLAPSPEAVARVEAENESMAAFEVGDYELAIAEVEEGLAVVPDDPTLLIIRGAFLEFLGNDNEAAQSLETARNNLNDPTTFHLTLAETYMKIGQYIKAEDEARASIELDNTISSTWLILAQSLEGQGRLDEAVEAYEQAGDIALANGDSEIVVLVRLALSRVGFNP